VLAAIIDGPIDADKADYIVRDSSRCELPYGHQLDLERLLRVLTVAIIPDEAEATKRVTLGVYDKGLVSAHAFGLARYQLLATVYWHHTSRIAKAMVQYATAIGLPSVVFGTDTADRELKEQELRAQLVEFVKSLVPPFEIRAVTPGARAAVGIDLLAQPPEDALAALGGTQAPDQGDGRTPRDWYPGTAWTDWLMLSWIGGLPCADSTSRHLVQGLRTRRLYKRIATFARRDAHEDIVRALDDRGWPERVELCKKLQQRISDRIRRDWTRLDTATPMEPDRFEELCSENLLVLIDLPRPSKKIGFDRPLGIVPELKEKSYRQDSRQATEDKGWRATMESMAESAAPVRVLCHPDVRNIVSALYAPVEQSMAKELRAVLGIRH
jgi:hypothetical protein